MTIDQFNKLYHKNINALTSFAKQLTRNKADAEDIVQETIIKAFVKKHTFKQNKSFKSWVFTILKNTFVSDYRKQKRRNEIEEINRGLSPSFQSKSTLQNNGISSLQIEEIDNCIHNLSEKMQKPFRMYLMGYKYKEIADELDLTIGTIKSRINFTRKKLKCMLSELEIAA